jgi:probable addiction module antidote protein
MPKRTRDYSSWRLEKLADPQIAKEYLNDALEDGSPEMFLKALLNVTQAQNNVAAVAEKAGIKRETIYRAFSRRGNPTLGTLNSVLGVLGLQLNVTTRGSRSSKSESGSSAIRLRRTGKSGSRRRITHETAGQMAFQFGVNSIANTQAAPKLQLSHAYTLPTIYYLNQETAPIEAVPIDLLVAGAANSAQIWKEG